MATSERLTLTEYSRKHQVSISTLRRRIKTGQVDFQLEDGKYFLLDSPLDEQKQLLSQRSTPMPHAPPQTNLGCRSGDESEIKEAPVKELPSDGQLASVRLESEGLFSTAREILAELKKAYALILQEKEEQILELKEEIADLTTLCQVLESENARLIKEASAKESMPPIAEWLDSLDSIK
ncbi:MAG: hypothetical protein KDD61_02335 [Bdellovibrionales bacterium]|nr:hypothetical protein [Bdellovibrionales bacterium]